MAGQERPKPETLEVFYDFVKGSPQRQVDRARDLDGKAVQIFMAATLVLGLAGFSQTTGGRGADWAVVALLALSLAAYAIVVYVAFHSLRPRAWQVIHADTLWEWRWQDQPEDLRHQIVSETAEATAYNQPMLKAKAEAIGTLLLATGVEVGLIALALISSLAG